MSFKYFVIFAEMRTGSNFLEENINSFDGLHSWGEVFNPVFIGGANKDELLGVTLKMREDDPHQLITRMRSETKGLAGFRFFHDHDPRILETIVHDPECAKIILSRNPAESYISHKIARETGQWRLGNFKNAKSTQVAFEAAEFERFLSEINGFQGFLKRTLQTTGQTAFYINYDDIQDVEVINGIARFLGVSDELKETNKKTKVQNPSTLKDKVSNYPEMVEAIGKIDFFGLSKTPNFEPHRAPVVRSYVAAKSAPLLYLPIKCGPQQAIEQWLQGFEGGAELLGGLSQKELRTWKAERATHRSFTVISHPAVRLHRAFCRYIVNISKDTYMGIRENLRNNFDLPLPDGAPDESYTLSDHKKAFLGFVDFIRGNLNGQTSTRVDATWASQSEVIKGFAEFALPDVILREDDLGRGLGNLCADLGLEAPSLSDMPEDTPYSLSEIYHEKLEAKIARTYARDYAQFGFGAWR